jgi:hypothetical protein
MATVEKARWERFERIIAAIEHATSRGAKVMWDENIEGRQFDVTVRFANGPHDYLTLVECKDQKQPVPVEKVDAFATKARDAKANKAVIISSAGFQSGCLDVARRHGIDLFRLIECVAEPPEAENLPTEPVLGVFDFVIHFPGNRAPLPIPESNNRLDYLLSKGVLRLGNVVESLQQFLDRTLATISAPPEFDKPQEIELPLQGVVMEIPTLLDATPVKSLTFTLIKQVKKILPPTLIDHHLLLKMHSGFELLDCLSNAPVTTIKALDLPIGFDTVLRAGSYYTGMLEQNYYCEKVENGSVWLVLVEGYAHGNLVQARLRAKVDVQKYYVEITDFSEILRLQKMYQRFCSTGGKS